MKRLDTMSTGGPGGADTLTLVNFPEGFRCLGILLRIFYPVAVVVGPVTPPTVLQMITAAFASFSLRYGKGGRKVAYPTVPGAEMRNVHRYGTRLDLPNNIAAITWGAAPTETVRLDLVIPFQLETDPQMKTRLPGWTQMKSMVIDIVEGPALNVGGLVTRGAGNVLVDVDVLYTPNALDQSGPVLSYSRANQASLRAEGPPQVLAGAWEISNPQATTPITLYSLDVGGRLEADVAPVYMPGDKYGLYYDTGISPITDEVTMAWSPQESEPSIEFPVGKPTYILAAQDIPQIQLRMLGWPLEDLADAQENAKEASESGPVLAEKPDIAATLPDAMVASLPAVMHPAGSPRFTLGAGLLAPGGAGEPYVSIPEFKGLFAGVSVETAAGAGAQTMSAAQTEQLAAVVKKTPGLSSLVMRPNKVAVTDPGKYAEALKTAQGSKGADGVSKFLRSVKL